MSGSLDDASLELPAYPNDKIVGVYKGQFNAATDTTRIQYTLASAPYYAWWYKIPHLFGQPVFLDLMTSTDNVTFSVSNSIAFSDFNYLYIYAGQSASSGGNPVGTVYYKLVASWIDNYMYRSDITPAQISQAVDVGSTYPPNTPIDPVLPNLTTSFDSRLNYRKVIAQDVSQQLNGNDVLVFSAIIPQVANPVAKVYVECFQNQVWMCHSGGVHDTYLLDDTMETGYGIWDYSPSLGFAHVRCRSDLSANSWSHNTTTIAGSQGLVRFWWKLLA